jgi:hypothetical protein
MIKVYKVCDAVSGKCDNRGFCTPNFLLERIRLELIIFIKLKVKVTP